MTIKPLIIWQSNLSDNIYNDWSEILMKLLIYCRLNRKKI